MRFTLVVDELKVEYAGCGTHQIKVELAVGEGGSYAPHVAASLREAAQKLDPRDSDALYAEAKQAIQDKEDLIEASRHIVAHRTGRTEFIMAASIDHLQTVMTRLGAYS